MGPFVSFSFPLIFLLLLLLPSTIAYTVRTAAEPVSSHSGPTNALYGHEQFHDEPLNAEQRQKRAAMWGSGFQVETNGWPNLLVSAEPPDNYNQGYLTVEHNRYRRMVPATDMRMIYWSEELAASAQRHANRCDFRHSRDRINVGENIWAAPYSNYSDAILRWWDEVNNPRCGCSQGYKHCCGHYIQVVWARTNLVGCGYARCRDVWGVLGRGHSNVFVCHYNPQGNRVFMSTNGQMLSSPAFTWAYDRGQVCSQCPPDAPACHNGLCYMPENYNSYNQSNNGYSNQRQYGYGRGGYQQNGQQNYGQQNQHQNYGQQNNQQQQNSQSNGQQQQQNQQQSQDQQNNGQQQQSQTTQQQQTQQNYGRQRYGQQQQQATQFGQTQQWGEGRAESTKINRNSVD